MPLIGVALDTFVTSVLIGNLTSGYCCFRKCSSVSGSDYVYFTLLIAISYFISISTSFSIFFALISSSFVAS